MKPAKALVPTLVVLIALATVVMSLVAPRSSKPRPRLSAATSVPSETQQQAWRESFDETVRRFPTGLVHRIDLSGHELQVGSQVWEVLTIDNKRALAGVAASYCASYDSGPRHLRIIDFLSGRTLAVYTENAGLITY
jgi:hypothetical protein